MSLPIAPATHQLLPSPPNMIQGERAREMRANALTARDARTSPGNRAPVVDRSKADPKLREAAEGMEAMFVDYLMKTMRQTLPKNDMDLESPATDIYRGMLDSEYAQKAVKAGGVGLADQIIAYWDSQRYTLPSRAYGQKVSPSVTKPATAAQGTARHDPTDESVRLTGGTHAGQPSD